MDSPTAGGNRNRKMWELETTSDGSTAFHRYAVLPRVCRQGRSVPRSCAERGPTPNGKEAPGTGDTLGGRSLAGESRHTVPLPHTMKPGESPHAVLLPLGWSPARDCWALSGFPNHGVRKLRLRGKAAFRSRSILVPVPAGPRRRALGVGVTPTAPVFRAKGSPNASRSQPR